MAALPTVGFILAQAPEETLLNLWQARLAEPQYAGGCRTSMADLAARCLTLLTALKPQGIGPYIAAAIASMAFGRVAPALQPFRM